MKQTICDLVAEIQERLEDAPSPLNKEIISSLKEIENRAWAMENRLVAYRNAIEELGFERRKDEIQKD